MTIPNFAVKRSTALMAAGLALVLGCCTLMWLFAPDVVGPVIIGGLALVALPALLKYPLTVTIVILFVAQETALSRQWLMSLGSEIYYQEILSIPIVLVVGALAWMVAVFRDTSPPAPLSGRVQAFIFLIAIAFVVAGVQAVVGGMSVLNASRQVLYPLVAFAFLFGLARRRFTIEARTLLVAGAGSTVTLAMLGVATAAQSNDSFVFYDSATAFIALVVVCVVFLSSQLRAAHVIVLISAVTIIALSNRRSIVIGLLIALLILALSRRGGIVRSRIVFGSAMAIGALSLVAGPALAITIGRLDVGLDTLRGLDADVSTQEHASDISVGFTHAITSLGGFGADASQLSGLAAVRSHQIYVHNEFLQLWLKHGLIVAAIATVAVLLLATAALRSPRRPTICRPEQWALARGAAAAWPALIVALMTAPFLSTTARWPALIGIMVAFISMSDILRDRSDDLAGQTRLMSSTKRVDGRNWP